MPKKTLPPQHQQNQPGKQKPMSPQPVSDDPTTKGCDKLKDRVALITGGDSGIGRAVAVAFAKEGTDIAISYLSEHDDAEETKNLVEKYGRRCLLFPGDIGSESFCKQIVSEVVREFGQLDILVNNAAEQHPQKSIEDITEEQLTNTFRTNIFAMFFMVKAAMKYLKEGSVIINTASVTMYKGSPELLDYSSTKGAIVAFTRSLSMNLAKQKIRVNAVAPGPIWTPLIPSTFPAEHVESFGGDVPMGRPGQPEEVAACYVFLASDESSYISGQTLHPNGGVVVNG